MSTDSLVAAIANRMRNGAEKRKYRVYESSLSGDQEVYASEDARSVATWLMQNGAYRASAVMDSGYRLSTPAGDDLFQGSARLNSWIETAIK